MADLSAVFSCQRSTNAALPLFSYVFEAVFVTPEEACVSENKAVLASVSCLAAVLH